MITDIPEPSEYKKLWMQSLLYSFNVIHDLVDDIEYREELVADNKQEIESYFIQNIKINLNSAIMVLYQWLENLMKSEIMEESYLLLLSWTASDRPTSTYRDKNFTEMQSVWWEELINLYRAIQHEKWYIADFIDKANDLRTKRNSVVHSLSDDEFDSTYLLRSIVHFLWIFYWDINVLSILQNTIETDRSFYDKYHNEIYKCSILNFMKDGLTNREINKYIEPYTISSRRYWCPFCLDKLHEIYEEEEMRRSFLDQSKEYIYCLICEKTYWVKKQDCTNDGCRWSYFNDDNYENLCLTCLSP